MIVPDVQPRASTANNVAGMRVAVEMEWRKDYINMETPAARELARHFERAVCTACLYHTALDIVLQLARLSNWHKLTRLKPFQLASQNALRA